MASDTAADDVLILSISSFVVLLSFVWEVVLRDFFTLQKVENPRSTEWQKYFICAPSATVSDTPETALQPSEEINKMQKERGVCH